MMQSLPAPSAVFTSKKAKILEVLSVPDSDYTDLSPKGSVDEGIRELIDEINVLDGLVTTSSCAGRVSVFLEGRKTLEPGQDDGQIATPGGKGGGGAWLFVSHDPVEDSRWIDELDMVDEDEDGQSAQTAGRRLIHFKFEPMILHVLTTSLSHAQFILRCALIAGFRESGAVSLETETPIVGIRSMGLGFESLIGHQADNSRIRTVSPSYLRTLMSIADERFSENQKRIGRFREALRKSVQGKPAKLNAEGDEWEDPAARKERKRAEGLRRKAEAEKLREKAQTNESDESIALAQSLSGF